jgi:hypothetical protein
MDRRKAKEQIESLVDHDVIGAIMDDIQPDTREDVDFIVDFMIQEIDGRRDEILRFFFDRLDDLRSSKMG